MNVSRKSTLNPQFVGAIDLVQSGKLSDEQREAVWDNPLMFHASEIGGLLQLEESLIYGLYGKKIEIVTLWALVSDESQSQAGLLRETWENSISTKKIELLEGISNTIVELINSPYKCKSPSTGLKKSRILHLLSLAMLYQAAMANQQNDGYSTSRHLTGAAMLFGMATGGTSNTSADTTAQISIQKMGALAKIAKDPKQAAKQQVKDCWDNWKKKSTQYKSKSAFARDMLDKFPSYKDENGRQVGLESQRVIERWCKEWESEPS